MRGAGGDSTFQFTPLREGRRLNPPPLRAAVPLFQFTPLREGRPDHVPLIKQLTKFQFTPLREGRRDVLYAYGFRMAISIHAPPRGATCACRVVGGITIFQFTPLREGRRRSAGHLPARLKRFQFTPLREGRLLLCPSARIKRIISIHAPPRGATDVADGQCAGGDAFQFTPLREGRHAVVVGLCAGRHISIHAPPRGATMNTSPLLRLVKYFNSRPSARGDTTDYWATIDGHISIHAPPRGATRLQR